MKWIFTLLVFLFVLTISLSAQWVQTSAPIDNALSIISDGSKIFVAQKDSGVYVSTDEGETWQSRNDDLLNNRKPFLEGITISGDTIYAFGNGVLKMHVDESTWSEYGIANLQTAFTVENSFCLYAYNSAIYKSTDYGANWTLATLDIFPGSGRFRKFLNTGTSLLAQHELGIYRSTNDGDNWVKVSSGLVTDGFGSIFMHTSGIYTSGIISSIIPILWRSTDDGISWTQISTNLPVGGIIRFFESSGSTLFCAKSGNGFYFSTNSGSDWTASNDGLNAFISINKLLVKGTNIFVSANGIYKRPLNDVTSVEINNVGEIPSSFSLLQNYPNPFNPETTIEFSVPQSEFVRLTIINILGEQIETLVSEELSAGNYKTKWNASNYPSGVYIAQFSSDSFIKSMKIVLEK